MIKSILDKIPRDRIRLAAVLLLIPILLRGLFFYQGFYFNTHVKTPDYAMFEVPTPPGPSGAVT
jgi:hypothetical protein